MQFSCFCHIWKRKTHKRTNKNDHVNFKIFHLIVQNLSIFSFNLNLKPTNGSDYNYEQCRVESIFALGETVTLNLNYVQKCQLNLSMSQLIFDCILVQFKVSIRQLVVLCCDKIFSNYTQTIVLKQFYSLRQMTVVICTYCIWTDFIVKINRTALNLNWKI